MEKTTERLISRAINSVVINAPDYRRPDCLVIHFAPPEDRSYHLELSGKADLKELTVIAPKAPAPAVTDRLLPGVLSHHIPRPIGG